VAKVRAMVLVPILDPDTHLDRLMDAYADAVNFTIRVGVEQGVTSLGSLSSLCYRPLRQRLTLKSMHVASAIKHAVGILRSWRRRKRKGLPVESVPVFKGTSMRLHKQVHRVDVDTGVLRLSTARGMRFYRIGVHKQVRRYEASGWRRRESLLLRRGGKYYLALCYEREVEPVPPEDVIGVDVNENNVTVCLGDRVVMFVTHEREIRTAYWLKRRRIQSKIRTGKRREQLLAKYGRREKERMKHVYHVVAKTIVQFAVERRCAIALENLKYIKKRIRYTREMTGRLHRWGARLFQRILAEKAERAGVAVLYVNPAHTSSLCPVCGHKLKESPKGQRVFVCPACGFEANRDVVGAINIRLRGLQKMGGATSAPDRPPMNPEAGIVRAVDVVDVLHPERVVGSTTSAALDGQVAQRSSQTALAGGGIQ